MKRTNQQNRAIHKFLSLLAAELNLAGLEMKIVLKGDTQIWWTPEACKEYLWRPLQKAMFQKDSTKDLDKHLEIDKVHEVLMRHLGEKFGLEYIPFPADEHQIGNFDVVDKTLTNKESW